MINTKHDISFGLAKIDYSALVHTTEVALQKTIDIIRGHVDRCHDAFAAKTPDSIKVYLEADWLLREAKNLVLVAETYAVVVGSHLRDRDSDGVVEFIYEKEKAQNGQGDSENK